MEKLSNSFSRLKADLFRAYQVRGGLHELVRWLKTFLHRYYARHQWAADPFVIALAIIGIVIVVSALLSGLIDKSGLPQVAVFIGIGAALGPWGLGVFNMTLDSPGLRAVATLSLTLVLFTDAVTLNIAEVRRYAGLAFRMLGPGTIFCAALTALAAWWLLDIQPLAAAVLGAALASTDPVLLRGLLRRRDISSVTRASLAS